MAQSSQTNYENGRNKSSTKQEAAESNPDFEALKQDFGNLKQQFADLLSHAAKATAGTAGDLGHRAAESYEDVMERVGKRPMTSLLIAFGLGYLMSRLIRK